jgi:hypothetical protein
VPRTARETASKAAPAIHGLCAEFGSGSKSFVNSRILVALLGIAVISQCGTGALNTFDVFFADS